jgi:phage terminase large subunit
MEALDYKAAYKLESHEVAIPFAVPASGGQLWRKRAPYIVFQGPAGTGKTRICCEFINFLCIRYPGIRVLMARQFRSTMTHSCMFTMGKEVLQPSEKVHFSPGQQSYIYPPRTGVSGTAKGKKGVCSEIVVSGLDDMAKIMSSQFDIIYLNEGTDIRKDQWEYLMTRNRNGVLPWQFMMMDCNPQHPKHWVKQMLDMGYIGDPNNVVLDIKGQLKDNPRWWDSERQDWTEAGYDFVFVKLGSLTGARRERLLEGRWASAEGQIYASFDRGIHVCKNFVPPTSWRRIWAFDFGYVNPFVWQNWAIHPDGHMYLFQEFYHTKTLVEDACRQIWNSVQGQPYPDALICDHDGEARATLEKYFRLPTLPAYKVVSDGIQAVQNRLTPLVYDGTNFSPDSEGIMVDRGRPRINFMESSLIHPPDPELQKESKPTSTLDEVEGYVWDLKSHEKQKGDIPVKLNDHGMDAKRYAVAFEDNLAIDPSEEEELIPFGLEYEVRISPF